MGVDGEGQEFHLEGRTSGDAWNGHSDEVSGRRVLSQDKIWRVRGSIKKRKSSNNSTTSHERGGKMNVVVTKVTELFGSLSNFGPSAHNKQPQIHLGALLYFIVNRRCHSSVYLLLCSTPGCCPSQVQTQVLKSCGPGRGHDDDHVVGLWRSLDGYTCGLHNCKIKRTRIRYIIECGWARSASVVHP